MRRCGCWTGTLRAAGVQECPRSEVNSKPDLCTINNLWATEYSIYSQTHGACTRYHLHLASESPMPLLCAFLLGLYFRSDHQRLCRACKHRQRSSVSPAAGTCGSQRAICSTFAMTACIAAHHQLSWLSRQQSASIVIPRQLSLTGREACRWRRGRRGDGPLPTQPRKLRKAHLRGVHRGCFDRLRTPVIRHECSEDQKVAKLCWKSYFGAMVSAELSFRGKCNCTSPNHSNRLGRLGFTDACVVYREQLQD